MKIRKTVTAAKAAANKANAQKGTGPTSVRGKEVSKRNAIRHGILAPDMLLPGESHTEFDALLREMIDTYRPVGCAEFNKVEVITLARWRQRRVYRAEAGEIEKILADRVPAAEYAASAHAPKFFQAGIDLKRIEELEKQIELKNRIDSESWIGKEDLAWIGDLPYGDPVRNLLSLNDLIKPKEGEQEAANLSAVIDAAAQGQEQRAAKNEAVSEELLETERALLLSCIDQLKTAIERAQLYHGEYSISKVEGQRKASLVPPEAVLNRLVRYEQHLQNIVSRAELELERMLRLRQGDEVPAPSARAS